MNTFFPHTRFHIPEVKSMGLTVLIRKLHRFPSADIQGVKVGDVLYYDLFRERQAEPAYLSNLIHFSRVMTKHFCPDNLKEEIELFQGSFEDPDQLFFFPPHPDWDDCFMIDDVSIHQLSYFRVIPKKLYPLIAKYCVDPDFFPSTHLFSKPTPGILLP